MIFQTAFIPLLVLKFTQMVLDSIMPAVIVMLPHSQSLLHFYESSLKGQLSVSLSKTNLFSFGSPKASV